MPKVTLELSTAAAAKMLPILEQQRDEIQGALEDICAQIERIRAAVGVSVSTRSAGTPAQYGEVTDWIVEYLSKKPSGARIPEIVKATGAKYPTVRRALHILKGDEKVTLERRTWAITKKGEAHLVI